MNFQSMVAGTDTKQANIPINALFDYICIAISNKGFRQVPSDICGFLTFFRHYKYSCGAE